ncbi:MAG TPA: glycosyltransferase family 4 protein [Vicinamibacterales bacterium]|nr:glycosyltransferase family 4 protein [Vicinamibacterales bacterium]
MRVLFVQRSLSPPGGGNAVAAWMVHALTGAHDVTTLTASPWSPADANAFYGTTIPSSITRLVVPPPWRWLAPLPDDQLTRLRMCSVLHHARPLASQFDLLITADNYAAFPKPGIQYVHFPARLQPVPARWGAIVHGYFALCDWLLGGTWTDAARNVTLANSQWTADGIARMNELPRATVLYPPVLDPGAGLPWHERDDAFLCVGRFHGSKRIELAIEILSGARAAVGSTRLIIVGSPVDAEYSERIRRLARRAGDWIEFREDLSRAQLNELMGRSRYGIQAMENEHFGMATAEMTRAGCLVFAHRSGGSPEVLNQEDALLWSSPDEAVRKIRDIAAADVEPLRAGLRAHAAQFSTESFTTRFRSLLLEPNIGPDIGTGGIGTGA